jgi:membrane-anchored protein YejM (alkaline phosphatase superfamily)
MQTRSYNATNNVIIKNVAIFNFMHNIFILYYMQNNKSNKKYTGKYCLSVKGTASWHDFIPVSHCVLICTPSWSSIMDTSITFTVLVSSAVVYISCHVFLHAVVSICVVFCACFIIYNNTITKCVLQQDN